MEMCYDGALVMPSNYAVMEEEEMTYVEGGVYLSNETLCTIGKVIFYSTALNPIGTVLVGLGIHKAYKMLCAGVGKIAAKIGAFSKVLAVAFAIVGFVSISDIGLDLIDALIQGKGIEIGIKRTWFGMPYGFDASVC